jgi:hypothetical protein
MPDINARFLVKLNILWKCRIWWLGWSSGWEGSGRYWVERSTLAVPCGKRYNSGIHDILNANSTSKVDSTVYCRTDYINKSRDSSVGIALGYVLDDRGSRVRFPTGAGNFSLHHRVQNGSGAHPASYPRGTRGSFPGGKAAGAWSWPFTSS